MNTKKTYTFRIKVKKTYVYGMHAKRTQIWRTNSDGQENLYGERIAMAKKTYI